LLGTKCFISGLLEHLRSERNDQKVVKVNNCVEVINKDDGGEENEGFLRVYPTQSEVLFYFFFVGIYMCIVVFFFIFLNFLC
jgi:hypothetical protein